MEKGIEILKRAWGMGWDCRIVGCKVGDKWQFELGENDSDLADLFQNEDCRFVSDFVCGPKLYINNDFMIRSGFPNDPGALGSLGSQMRDIRESMSGVY